MTTFSRPAAYSGMARMLRLSMPSTLRVLCSKKTSEYQRT